MQDPVTQIRPWAELAYFFSGPLLAIIAIFGLQQVFLLKKDIKIRSERAAKEKAIEYAQRYLTVFVPLQNKADTIFKERKLEAYKGPIGDFTIESLSHKYVHNAFE